MNTGKSVLIAIAILLGVFVLVAIVSAFVTLPNHLETGASPSQAIQHQETALDQSPSPSRGSELQEKSPREQTAPSRTRASDETSVLVNIICFTNENSPLHPISGSGIIIDPRGVVLTTAHIAQYFLLDEYTECFIRQGSPATLRHQAELLYIPPTWITEHKDLITKSVSHGTGEHDYAFLRITNTQSSFSFVSPDPRASGIKTIFDEDGNESEEIELDVGTHVSVLAYPSEFLEGKSVVEHLLPVSTQSVITKLFTFGSQTLDLFSLKGTPLAQQGSSGGGVVGNDGRLKAIIVSSSQDQPLQERTLQAITIGHIDRSLQEHLGKDLHEFLSEDLTTLATSFKETVQASLSALLRNELKR